MPRASSAAISCFRQPMTSLLECRRQVGVVCHRGDRLARQTARLGAGEQCRPAAEDGEHVAPVAAGVLVRGSTCVRCRAGCRAAARRCRGHRRYSTGLLVWRCRRHGLHRHAARAVTRRAAPAPRRESPCRVPRRGDASSHLLKKRLRILAAISLALSYKKRNPYLGGLDERTSRASIRSAPSTPRPCRYTDGSARQATDHHRPSSAAGHHAGDAARLVHPPRRHDDLRRRDRRPLPRVASDRPHPMGIGASGAHRRRRPKGRGSAWSRRSVADPNTRSTRCLRRETRRDRHQAGHGELRVSPCSNSSTRGRRVAEGAHYVTVMDLGVRSTLLSPVNGIVRQRFPEEKVQAWVKHNIEEVGQLEYLLPQLLVR